MKKTLQVITAILLISVSFAAGYLFNRSSSGKSGADRKILYYVDPMNPGFKSDKPGIAPCGMPMEPVYAEGSGGSPESPAAGGGAVRITPARQQEIGVRVAQVEKKATTHTIRLVGRVTPDEARTYRITAATDTWVRKVFPPTTGSLVRKDDPLMAYFTTGFLSAANAYLFALDTQDRHMQTADVSQPQAQNIDFQMRQALGNLINMGVSESQVREMAKTRKAPQFIEVRSPSDGFILVRGVTPGQFVTAGTEIFRLANLDKVWILAEIFENEGQFIKPGTRVKVTHPQMNKTFDAKVSNILPQFDPQTRTLKFRLEADNAGYILRPDMFVDVELPVNLPAAMTAPTDAIIDTGTRKTVYVDRGDGYFEPRRVEIGWRLGKVAEITGGLMPGEKIVVSGNFLIDSESRMRAAAQGIFGSPTKDPVCGMFVDEDKTAAAGMTSTYQGRTYFFCKEECKTDFDKNPKKYVDTKLIPHVSASHEEHNKAISRASKEKSPKSAKTHGGSGTQMQNADKSLDKRQEEARDRDFPGAQYLEQDRKYYKMDEMKDTESAPGSRTESGTNAETKPAVAPQPAGK